MAEHFTASDVDRETKRLKRDLEGWREVILPVHSIFIWEKSSFPGMIGAATTVLFLVLWSADPSTLTALSLIAMLAALVDYLVPIITQHVCSPDSWTAAKERRLELVCKNIATDKFKVIKFVKNVYALRQTSPKMYYIVVILTLLLLAWIGNVVNNLFLTYLFVTFLLLLPGIRHHGYMDQVLSMLQPIFSKFPGSVTKNKKLE